MITFCTTTKKFSTIFDAQRFQCFVYKGKLYDYYNIVIALLILLKDLYIN